MQYYYMLSILLLFSVFIYYINYIYLNIQNTTAITLHAFFFSLIIIFANKMSFFNFETSIKFFLEKVDFKNLLLNIILGLSLFSSSLSINLKKLLDYKWEIFSLAFITTIFSTFLIGTIIYCILFFFKISISYIYCLIFGSIISPTDPISVLSTTKKISTKLDLTTKISGESLFNDGIGIVLFMMFYHMIFNHHLSFINLIFTVFLKETMGGVFFGFFLGILSYNLIKRIKDPKLEVLISFCIATYGYNYAMQINISGPLSMVISGIIIGNFKTKNIITKKGKKYLYIFWELIEDLLNYILYLLIGLEIILLSYKWYYIFLGLSAIPIVLFSRFITVGIPMNIFKIYRNYSPFIITILTWGGLRGGLAIAMALSIPNYSPYYDIILFSTYSVVLFSIIFQGTSIEYIIKYKL